MLAHVQGVHIVNEALLLKVPLNLVMFVVDLRIELDNE